MPIQIVRDNITNMKVDAIVNAAGPSLLGGGGVDGAVHRAAGPGLLAECRALGGCETGQAKLTGAYRLPCKYVIHTVGPIWKGGRCGERVLLESCYNASLRLAWENGCETVAFPLLSSGAYGYPKADALQVAMETIGRFLLNHDMAVYLVIFDRETYRIGEKLFADIAVYIDQHYVDEHSDSAVEQARRHRAALESISAGAGEMKASTESKPKENLFLDVAAPFAAQAAMPLGATPPCLGDVLAQLDEGFSKTLLRLIDKKGITDAQCYKKANIDRKLFSKIRSNPDYRPSKPTVLAFAVALELSLEETAELLKRAGFALSHSNKFDIIVEFFISEGIYDILVINEALFAFDQPLLGG